MNVIGIENIRFHVALSNGLSPVGPRYKAASVKMNRAGHSTWLTAKIDGQRANLDGQRIMNDIYNAVWKSDNRVDCQLLFVSSVMIFFFFKSKVLRGR